MERVVKLFIGVLVMSICANINAFGQGREVELVYQTPMILMEENTFTNSLDLKKETISWGFEVVYYHKVNELTPYLTLRRGYLFGRRGVQKRYEKLGGLSRFDWAGSGAVQVIQELNTIEFGYTIGAMYKVTKNIRLGLDLNLIFPPMGKDSRLIYRVKEEELINGQLEIVTYENLLARNEEEDWIQYHSDFDVVWQWMRFGIGVDYNLGRFSFVGKLDFKTRKIQMRNEYHIGKDEYSFRTYYITPKIGINYRLFGKI